MRSESALRTSRSTRAAARESQFAPVHWQRSEEPLVPNDNRVLQGKILADQNSLHPKIIKRVGTPRSTVFDSFSPRMLRLGTESSET
jgi:hypothetical protein